MTARPRARVNDFILRPRPGLPTTAVVDRPRARVMYLSGCQGHINIADNSYCSIEMNILR